MNSYIPRKLVGIEVSDGDLRISVVRSAFNKKQLLSSFVLEGFEGMETDERTAEIEKLADRHGLRGAWLFLTLPESLGLVRELEFPIEVRERVRAAVRLQIDGLSPWTEEEIYWDMGWEEPKKSKKSFVVNVSILPRETLEPWIELFEVANLPLRGVTLSSFAVGHAAKLLWPDNGTLMLIGLEEQRAAGCLISNGRLKSASLEESGPADERAGEIVRRLSSLSRGTSLDGARTVAYGPGRSNLDEDNPSPPIEGVEDSLGQVFGSLAAALSGLSESPYYLNLLPKERRYQSDRMQLVPSFVLGVIFVFAIGMLILRAPYQWSVYAVELDATIQEIAPTVGDLSEKEAELSSVSEKYKALSTHLSGGERTLESLQELVRVLPTDTWFSAFSLQNGTISVSGFSGSASEIQRLIEESPMFKSAEFTSSVTRSESGRDRFTLRFQVEGNL